MNIEEVLKRAYESPDAINKVNEALYYIRLSECKAIQERRRKEMQKEMQKEMRVVKCESRTQPGTFNLRELNKHLIH